MSLPPPLLSLLAPPGDIVEQAFTNTVLQKRLARNVSRLDIRLQLRQGIPRIAFLDGGRARQVIGNVLGNAIKVSAGPAEPAASQDGDGAADTAFLSTQLLLRHRRSLSGAPAATCCCCSPRSHGTLPLSVPSQFTHTGSVIVIADFIEDGRILRVTIVDSGIGLSEEGLSRLFKPFAQARSGQRDSSWGSRGSCVAMLWRGGDGAAIPHSRMLISSLRPAALRRLRERTRSGALAARASASASAATSAAPSGVRPRAGLSLTADAPPRHQLR